VNRQSIFLRLLIGLGGAKILLGVLFLLCIHPMGALAIPETEATPGAKGKQPAAGVVLRGDEVSQFSTRKAADILMARLRRLKEREADLDQREKNLEMLKREIENRIEEMKRLQAVLETRVRQAKAQEDARFQHLVGVYSAMQPARAAALLNKMDDSTVVKIFAMMKSRKVAAILALMEPEKAARISSALTKNQAP